MEGSFIIMHKYSNYMTIFIMVLQYTYKDHPMINVSFEKKNIPNLCVNVIQNRVLLAELCLLVV